MAISRPAIRLREAKAQHGLGGDVLVSARRANGMVEVSVSDEGMGVPPGEREHVFRKFWRGGAAGGMIGTGNTGLGLFIAEGLVHAMGGRIWMAEKAGRGSTFVFELPAARTETPVERE